MKENPALKRSLVLQSFSPLFLLLFIKHVYLIRMPVLIGKFFSALRTEGVSVVQRAVEHPLFWDFMIVAICLVWITITGLVALGFRGMQDSGFESKGENVVVSDDKKDAGISFLVSFVLPLLVDEVTGLREFIFFLTMLTMVLCLLIRTNLFYQNPLLALLGYRVCSFKVVDPTEDLQPYANMELIGITRGKPIAHEAPIKRKYIADNVFLIYND